jgi:AcrR family transcriptional regulator
VARRSRRSSADRPGGDRSGPPENDAHRIIDAAFAEIAVTGWRRVSLATVAAAADLPILRVYRTFRSKQAILCGFFRRIDEAVLADPPPAEEGEHPRDRLFDLMMRRLDALRPYKPALEVLRRELPSDPPAMLIAGAALLRSARWMHEAAEIDTGGIRGAIAIKLTGAAYLATTRVWHRDDSPDLGQTMAALDARLRRVERWLSPARQPQPGGEARPA